MNNQGNSTPEHAASAEHRYQNSDIELLSFELERLLRDSEDRNFREGYRRVSSRRAAGLIQSTIFRLSTHFGFSDVLVVNQSKEFIPDEIFQSLQLRLSISGPTGQIGFTDDFSSLGTHSFVVGFFGFNTRHPLATNMESSLFQSLQLARQIKKGGIGLFLFPGYGNTFTRNEAIKHFADLGLSVTAVLRTPRMFFPGTGIRSLLVIVEKTEKDKTFVLEIDQYESFDMCLSNFFDNVDTGEIQSGIQVNLPSFRGFEAHLASEQMAYVSDAYKRDYIEMQLKDVALDFKRYQENIEVEHLESSIFISMTGKIFVVRRREELDRRLRNSFQVILDDTKALPEYLANFLNSPYGKLCIEEVKGLGTDLNINLRPPQLREMRIAVPSLEIQKKVGYFVNALATLQNLVEDIEEKVALNPSLTNSLLPQLEDALSVFQKLSVEDQIRAMIRRGETKHIEFKSTFVLDVRQNIKDDKRKTDVIKTVAGFLNADGGDLLIGVNDSREITGVDEEMRRFYASSTDKYLLNFKAAIETRLGKQFYPYINYELHQIDNRHILHVQCRPSDKAVFVDGKDFYVRTNPATDKLEGYELQAYLDTRFSNTARLG